jgi:diacylglycerol kinase (ATP)
VTQVALVVHPIKVADPEALADLVRKRCAELGWPQPTVFETSAEDPGVGQARQAIADGAELVIAAGGDGTVRAVAHSLATSSATLGVVPQGTGNLLGRNLGIPTDIPEAVEVALTGEDRVIDVGKVVNRGDGEGDVFTVMSGIGLDAAMVRDAPEPLKKRVGWLAYLVGIARSLRGERLKVEITVDGAEPLRRSARAVLVGNVGELQGGVDLLPESRPDNGKLDVAILAARGPIEWSAVLIGSLLGKHPSRGDRRLERLRGGHILVRTRSAQAREVDGDLLADGPDLEVEVLPGALTVRVPRREANADDSKEK